MPASAEFPARFTVDYPDRQLNRWSTLFRAFAIIPIWIVLVFLSNAGFQAGEKGLNLSLSGVVAIPTLLLILFRQKYPRWWFDWNLAFSRFALRVGAYLLLLTDVYPSTEEEQSVHLQLDYPDAKKDLNRWLPLVKWLLAIPHVVVLVFLGIAALFVVIAAWFAILFTGRYPRPLFDFVAGVLRWNVRVAAYALLLITDQYPSFSLQP